MKKKLLFLSPAIPDDNSTGLQRRGANHLRGLSQNMEVHTLVLKVNYDGKTQIPEHISALCSSSKIIDVKIKSPIIKSSLPLTTFFNEILQPNHKRLLPSNDSLKEIANIINQQQFDCIFCFRLRMGAVIEELEKRGWIKPVKRKLVDFDDIESIAIQREIQEKGHQMGFEYRQIKQRQAKQTKAQELRYLNKFNSVFTCSNIDQEKLSALAPNANVEVVPNSISLPQLKEEPKPNSKANGGFQILFVGTMNYIPNEDAAVWFVEDILPLVREKTAAQVDVTIVGFNPTDKVKALAEHQGVTVTGGVPKIEPYYLSHDIVISPIRFGGGTRIKILEAMSYQKPIVSTSIGAEGIEVSHMENLLLAEDAESFSSACVTLLETPEIAQKVANNGRQLVEQQYTVEVIGKHLTSLI